MVVMSVSMVKPGTTGLGFCSDAIRDIRYDSPFTAMELRIPWLVKSVKEPDCKETHRRTQRHRAHSDVHVGEPARVHRHRDRSMLISISLAWSAHRVMRCEHRLRCPCCWRQHRYGLCLLEGEEFVGNRRVREVTCDPPAEEATLTSCATGSKQALMLALSQQPVSFTIEADQFFFLFKANVLTTLCGTKLEAYPGLRHRKWHGPPADETQSWSGTWSEQGCTRLQCAKRGAGECGLSSAPPSCPAVTAATEVANLVRDTAGFEERV